VPTIKKELNKFVFVNVGKEMVYNVKVQGYSKWFNCCLETGLLGHLITLHVTIYFGINILNT